MFIDIVVAISSNVWPFIYDQALRTKRKDATKRDECEEEAEQDQLRETLDDELNEDMRET